MEDMSMYQKAKFVADKAKQKKLISLIQEGKHDLVLFEVPKNFDKDILNGVEIAEAEVQKHAKIGEDYWLKCIKDSPHVNSLCMMVNKDGHEGKLEGCYKFKSYFKVMRAFKDTSKSRIASEQVKANSVIHKDKVKLDVDCNTLSSLIELQAEDHGQPEEKKKKEKKHKDSDKSKKKDKKEKKDKKDKKDKKEKKEKKEKKDKKE